MRPRVPVIESLLTYRAEKNRLLHMPGHCGGKGLASRELAAIGSLDFTEVPGLDDLHRPCQMLQEASELLAAAFGARESFFLVNGASSGIHCLFLSASNPGEPVLIPRNAHSSFYAGLVLSGAVPVYYPARLEQRGIAVAPETGSIARALEKNAAATAVFMVSPTYYGTAADIAEAVSQTAGFGKMVLVDEAHGAHFGFHPRFPTPALAQGSAAVVHGMHKSLPVLTQGAVLHTGLNFAPLERLRQAYHLLTTTSPSYPLLASLDQARALMVEQGYELLEKALQWADKYRKKIASLAGLDCPGEEWLEIPGVKGYDPMKVLVEVKGLSLTGYQVAALLRKQYRIQVEMATADFILAMFSLCHGEEDWAGFYSALEEISRKYPGRSGYSGPGILVPPAPQVAMTPRQAYFAGSVRVKLAVAAGKIAAEMVAGYPPGIPCLLPGEMITAEILDYIGFLKGSGANVHGPQDPELNYIHIIDRA